ncbi:unnamed protein product [Phytophthora lilii]|uniref:Unnamed protein product n=1 Tax=Phytophthora lilii TaxID=2077276 RepID=A0A9W6UCH7_9STRA|nr:unnamed protein product [Phytophthora lilii]
MYRLNYTTNLLPRVLSRLFSQNLFSDFGNGISHQHTSLWCPDSIMAPTDDGDFFNMLSFRQPNRFIGIAPGSSPPKQSFGDSTMGLYRHCDRRSLKTGIDTFTTLKLREQSKHSSLGKDVFFYDGTRQVHCGERKQQTDWGEVSGITENSSWGFESSFDASEPWTARTHAWENMGDRTGLSEYYCRPPAREDKKSLHGIAIPVKFACRNHIDEAPLEIHEMDLIEVRVCDSEQTM